MSKSRDEETKSDGDRGSDERWGTAEFAESTMGGMERGRIAR